MMLRYLPIWALLAACTDTPSPDDTDSGEPAAMAGLPTGTSTWSGTGTVGGAAFLLSATLTQADGDVSGTATVEDDPEAPVGIGRGVYTVTGTHEPGSGLVALAPGDWTEEPAIAIELVGFSGAYDPDTGSLNGSVADYASGTDNTLAGGPATLTRVGGDGAPLDFGDGARGLPTGSRPFSGTFQCTGPQREVQGELGYDGDGGLTGSITFGDPTLADNPNTFAISGVHNPSTGGVTLVPGLYEDTDHTYAAFFVEASYDPTGDTLVGELRQNVGSCPADLWQVAF